MKHNEYVEANRQLWNETADVHARVRGEQLLERVRAADFTTFKDVEKHLFGKIGLAGKAVVQLACNNGRELISVKKAGAGRCVGFDLSDKFIAEGQALVQASGVQVELVRASVYDIPHTYDGQFDLVYITIGALGWMPNLVQFFEIATRLLNPTGQIFIYEMHPILNMFDPPTGLEIKRSYFETEPIVEGEGPDYLDPSAVIKGTSYWFPHTLSDVLGGCLRNGMVVTHFQEYPQDISNAFKSFEEFEMKPPLSYSLLARRTAPQE